MVSSDQKKSVIIIKRPVVGGGGHHGGSWKVAYADFVTAMMAFFLLMWLLNISSADKKKQIQQYFKTFSLLEGGGSFGNASSDALAALDGGKNCDEQTRLMAAQSKEELALVERDAKSSLNRRLTGLEAGVSVHVVGSAVRVEMSQQTLFESGTATLTPLGEKIVIAIGEEMVALQRPIEIEGHSDGTRFGNARYSNWDLSVDRALTVRRVFQTNNINLDVRRVSGLADQMPLYPGDPGDPRNRRITIVVPVERAEPRTQVLGEQAPIAVDSLGSSP
jgi:chemotaxis protein MotB